MGFCLDHSDSSSDVVDLLVESLMLPETPPARKIARLYCISDVLFNSSAPVRHAASYRSLIQSRLSDVFKSLRETHQQQITLRGRLSARTILDKVEAVLGAWKKWSIYPDAFIVELTKIFHGQSQSSSNTQSNTNESVSINHTQSSQTS